MKPHFQVPGLGWPFMLAANANRSKPPPPSLAAGSHLAEEEEEEQPRRCSTSSGRLSARSTGNEALWAVLKAALVRTATGVVDFEYPI